MDGISASSANYNLYQSALAQADVANKLDMAVLQKTQEIARQQGSAAVQLIESAGSVIDVRA